MRKLEEYYSQEAALTEVAGTLCDQGLRLDRHRAHIDDLVINLVIKYLAEYIGSGESADVDKIILDVKARIEMADKSNYLGGLVMEAFFGMLGVHAKVEKDGGDYFAFKCLADIRSTAAIVREIIFNNNFRCFNDFFVGLDFGSGTGILMMAMAIAARRQQIKEMILFGFDLEQDAVERSKVVLGKVLSEDSFKVWQRDITHRDLWHALRELPISFLVSETINSRTPEASIDGEGNLIVAESAAVGLYDDIVRTSDPFLEVLKSGFHERPDLVHDIRMGVTAMFPDIANGLYCPRREDPTLLLQTSPNPRPLRLHEVGDEFGDYEDLGLGFRRWSERDDDGDGGETLEDVITESWGQERLARIMKLNALGKKEGIEAVLAAMEEDD